MVRLVRLVFRSRLSDIRRVEGISGRFSRALAPVGARTGAGGRESEDEHSNGVPPKQQTARTPQAGRVQDAITPSASDEMVRVAADKDVELTPDVGWIIKGAALDDMDAKDIKVVKAVAQKRGYPSLVKACDKLLAEIALR